MKVYQNSIISIQPDIRPDIGYPAEYPAAGYPANSVSGATQNKNAFFWRQEQIAINCRVVY